MIILRKAAGTRMPNQSNRGSGARVQAFALAQMLIDHNIGVSPVASYETKRIDSDYLTGE